MAEVGRIPIAVTAKLVIEYRIGDEVTVHEEPIVFGQKPTLYLVDEERVGDQL